MPGMQEERSAAAIAAPAFAPDVAWLLSESNDRDAYASYIDQAIWAAIGRQLAQLHQSVTREPLPAPLAGALERLERSFSAVSAEPPITAPQVRPPASREAPIRRARS